jgi:hypothetical protein
MPSCAYCNVNAFFCRFEGKVLHATLVDLAGHIEEFHGRENTTACQTVDIGPTFSGGVHAHLTVSENDARLALIEATDSQLALAEAQLTASQNESDLAEARTDLKRKR